MLRLDGVTQLGTPVNSADGVRVAACPLARLRSWTLEMAATVVGDQAAHTERDEGCDTVVIRFAAPGSLAVMAFPAP